MNLRAPILGGLLAAVLPAQEVLWRVAGSGTSSSQTSFGGVSAFIGDVDGDGFDDVATNVRRRPNGWEIWILSGRDGSTLRIDPSPRPGHSILDIVATGDMNGDGVGDYAASSYPALVSQADSVAVVRSSRDGTTIWQVATLWSTEFGWQLVGDLDLDGDGLGDLVVSAPRENVTGAVRAYDHFGNLLYTMPMGLFPRNLDRLGGDLDGDGSDDFLAGVSTEQGIGAVRLVSGRTGEVLVSGFGEQPGDAMGTGDVRGCGDVDGDGWLDFAGSSDGGLLPGIVSVFSGHTGRIIYTWRRPFGSGYGRTLAAGDLDLDGIHDLLIYTVLCNNNQALDWRTLRGGGVVKPICQGRPGGTQFGDGVEIGPPQPGNPFPVILISEPGFGPAGPLAPYGRINLLRATPTGVAPLGPACNGTLARAPRLGFTDYGPGGVQLHVSDGPPSATALLALGLSSTTWAGSSLPLVLDPFGFAGCRLFTAVDVALPVALDATGYGAFAIAQPLNTFQLTLHGQGFVLGSGTQAPGALTGGLRWPQ